MSESREKKNRYNQKLEFIAVFDKWVKSEPPLFNFIKWRKWLKNKPVFKYTQQ